MKQHDSDCFNAVTEEDLDFTSHFVQVQRRSDGAVSEDPFMQLSAQVARHQRFRGEVAQVVELRSSSAPEFEDIPESVGSEEACSSPTFLDQRVKGDRRTVDKHVNFW
ncbi:hypothetical protein AX769_22100 (plasmid) [Frondihabitans sp. PAMC 28766]|nr:hypothetical protein AX769_22100 [Frondihabitans sp. PAMC 28766]